MYKQTCFAIAAAFSLVNVSRADLKWLADVYTVAATDDIATAVAYFQFTNSGNYPVTIEDVRTSCDCTSINWEARQYAPGESGVVSAIYHINAQVGERDLRIFVSTHAVHNNEDERRERALTVHVKIGELITIAPSLLLWSINGGLRPKSATITLNNSQLIESVESTQQSEECELDVEIIDSGKQCRLTVLPKKLTNRIAQLQLLIHLKDGRGLKKELFLMQR